MVLYVWPEKKTVDDDDPPSSLVFHCDVAFKGDTQKVAQAKERLCSDDSSLHLVSSE